MRRRNTPATWTYRPPREPASIVLFRRTMFEPPDGRSYAREYQPEGSTWSPATVLFVEGIRAGKINRIEPLIYCRVSMAHPELPG